MAARPNLLFIFTDQQNPYALGASGNPWLATPHLDALAARGTRFTASYCASPLCSPSRASLVTGEFPTKHRVTTNHLHLPPAMPHLGGILGAAGYETAWAGKWHVPQEYPLPAEGLPGFTILPYPGREEDRHGYPLRIAGRPGNWEHNLGEFADAPTAEVAAEFLRRRHDRPFCLVVALMNPHDICFWHDLPPAFKPPEGELPPLPANFASDPAEPEFVTRRRWDNVGEWDERMWRRYLSAYYRYAEHADRDTGIVLEALRSAGLESTTTVLFTSDHGEGATAHRWPEKLMLYEEPAGVPFILAGPGVPAGRVDNKRLISGVDCFPTLCGAAGVAPPPGLAGMDLMPLVRDPAAVGREAVVCELQQVWDGDAGQGRMIRDARHKYVAFNDGARPEMLFDLQEDPGETRDLARDAAGAAVRKKLRDRLAGWLAATGDAFTMPPA